MSRNQRWLVLGAGTFLAAVVLALGGYPAESPVKPAGLEQKIEAARTRADHQKIAAVYEQHNKHFTFGEGAFSRALREPCQQVSGRCGNKPGAGEAASPDSSRIAVTGSG